MSFIENKITDTLKTNYMPYATSVIVSRAIPEIDGLKPSHRKLLYTMYKMGLLSGNRTKSANVVGQTMKLNPHGDAAIYETLVRLTKGNGSLLYPLIDSKGNFGRIYSRDMAYAASRYTEVKLDSFCEQMFADIDKDVVDFIDNYDGTMKEPRLLPTTFPNILVNPNQGIAVGMASNICSFNLGEICDSVSAFIKDEKVDLSEHIKAPDFSTGGEIIACQEELNSIYETGKGSFKIRAKYKYDKKNNCIEIYEIPYTTTSEAIIDKIIELIKGGKIREISDIRDETDLKGLKITIDLKRGTNVETLMAKLYKNTPLMDTFSCNFNILINGSPGLLGVRGIIKEWIVFRVGCIKRGISFDINKKREKLHLLNGLSRILLDIDKAISIIRGTESEDMVVPNLMNGFMIDEVQASYVAEIKLRNLNKEFILKRTAEISKLIEDIEELTSILGSDSKIKKLIISQLADVKKRYYVERKTDIVSDDLVEYNEDEEIPDYPIKITFTEENYLKKIAVHPNKPIPEQKIKEGDVVLCEFDGTNRAEIIMFSNKQNAYKLRACDLEDQKPLSFGEYLPNMLGLSADEKIIYMVGTLDFKGYILFCFENGKIAKIPLNAYATKNNRKKLQNAYSDISELCSVKFILEDTDMIAFSDNDKALTFNTEKISVKTTKSSQGITVMNVKKGSRMVAVNFDFETVVKNKEYYRTKNIPAGGNILKSTDGGYTQLSLI